jgi:hypothetical protein
MTATRETFSGAKSGRRLAARPPAPIARIALTLLAAAAFAGCATQQRAEDAPPPQQQRVQTASDVKRGSLEGAVTSPLRDLNLIKTKIPDALLQARANPYAAPVPATCEHLIELVQPLNDALGADLDAPPGSKDDLMHDLGGTGLGLVADTASDVIPFRGWMRKLTGAERREKLVAASIAAGAVRRGYLKGFGEVLGCNPPATPMHKNPGDGKSEKNDKSDAPRASGDAK